MAANDGGNGSTAKEDMDKFQERVKPRCIIWISSLKLQNLLTLGSQTLIGVWDSFSLQFLTISMPRFIETDKDVQKY